MSPPREHATSVERRARAPESLELPPDYAGGVTRADLWLVALTSALVGGIACGVALALLVR